MTNLENIEQNKIEDTVNNIEIEESKDTPITEEVNNPDSAKNISSFEKSNKPGNNRRGSRSNNRDSARNQEFQTEVIKIKKICKVVKGGRRFRFSALVVSGNKKGRVGFGLAKAYEVPDAIKKAQKQANKNMFNVPIVGKQGTVSHEITGVVGASKILIKPAPEGTGIVAGGSIRILLELSGIKNIYTKSLGSRSDLNMILATADGLKRLRTIEQVAALRDKDVKELASRK